MKEKERNGISQSFVMGVISLVFLIIGYQTALLIHNSAVTKIAACRDEPDTVYVFRDVVSSAPVSTGDSVQRRNASHSPRELHFTASLFPTGPQATPAEPSAAFLG